MLREDGFTGCFLFVHFFQEVFFVCKDRFIISAALVPYYHHLMVVLKFFILKTILLADHRSCNIDIMIFCQLLGPGPVEHAETKSHRFTPRKFPIDGWKITFLLGPLVTSQGKTRC